MSESNLRGRFVWYELMTTDVEAAVAFYTRITGWGTAPFGQGDVPYTMWTNGGNPIGGVMKLPEEARRQGTPPSWLAYVGAPDVDATARQAVELGGTILKAPEDIPAVGRYAVLADPQGAAFGIYRPVGSFSGGAATAATAAGQFSWHELATTDQESAFRFYNALFGWEKTEAMDMGEMGVYQMYGREGATLGGMFRKPKEMPGPPAWLYYVKVEDVHATTPEAQELGGKVLNGPMEVPGGDWIAQCMDPQGAMFAIHSSKK